jgi:hypothetical protein
MDQTILGRMCEAVILIGPGPCVPWQHCFSSGNIVAMLVLDIQSHMCQLSFTLVIFRDRVIVK